MIEQEIRQALNLLLRTEATFMPVKLLSAIE
jgi:hypothetical protein